LADSRVLCGLLNSFVPGTFTSEVLLNDRWTINLVLRTAEDILGIHSSVSSADLMEADEKATCSYMCSLFMLGYKFRQSRAAVCRQNELMVKINSAQEELQRFPPLLESMTDMKRKKELSELLEKWQEETGWIEMNYDLPKCREWLRHAEASQQKARALISEKIRQRFDILTVPRNMTINELVDLLAINLSLTCGSGFFSCSMKETLWVGRKVVLRDVKKGEFYDDFTGNGSQKKSVREMLGARPFEVIEVSPSQFAGVYEIFLESQTRNKTLKVGSKFLYQVFPGTSHQCQRLMFNAAKTGDLDTVKKLVVFFKRDREFINSKESGSGNTALHFACRNGHLVYSFAVYLKCLMLAMHICVSSVCLSVCLGSWFVFFLLLCRYLSSLSSLQSQNFIPDLSIPSTALFCFTANSTPVFPILQVKHARDKLKKS
jgi:hypothetical protein